MKLSLGRKIGGGFAILLLFTSITALTGYWLARTSVNDSADITTRFERMSLDYRINNSFQIAAGAIRGYLYYKDSKFLNLYESEIANTRSLLMQRKENSSVEKKPVIEKLIKMVDEYDLAVREQVLVLANTGQDEEAKKAGLKVAPLANEIDRIIKESVDENEKKSKALLQTVEHHAMRGQNVITITALSALLIGALLSLIITRSITRPIAVMMESAHNLAAGNFKHEIKIQSSDEVGELASALEKTRIKLKELIGDLVNSAHTISAQSQQLAAAIEEVSATSEEVASISNQVASSADQTLESARTASGEAYRVAEVAQSGSRVIGDTVVKIQTIASASVEVNSSISQLSELSRRIGHITEIITGIASQTNLLALNAAIEAARAGEQGRGFAVVAEEVRKLAEQSAAAAGEIAQLISQIQTGIEETTAAVNRATDEVQEGVSLAGEAGNAINQIQNAINRTISLVENVSNEIAAAAQGIQQLTTSNEQIAGTIHQISSSAQEMAQVAENLQQAAARFRI